MYNVVDDALRNTGALPDDNMSDVDGRRCVYFISELDRTEAGGYIPCIAVEGESGYYRTDWDWGTDIKLAQKIADEKNSTLGFTPKEALLIILGTMRIK